MKNMIPNNIKSHPFGYLFMTSILILASCGTQTETNNPIENPTEIYVDSDYGLTFNQFQSSGMELGSLEMKPFHEIIKANGILDVPPENRAEVSCYFGGTVIDMNLLPGKQIKKNEVLFTLENPEYIEIQQAYLEAKGQLAYLKSDYERQKNLAKDHVTSQKNYLKSEADYTVTRVKVESLSKKLELMNIKPNTLTLENIRTTIDVLSPFDGFVTAVNISIGSYLHPSTSAVSLVNSDHLHLELNIFEKDLAKINVGQQIQFQIQDENSTRYNAVVHLVNKTVDAKTRTIGVHGHLLNEELKTTFSPGMYVQADIYSSSFSRIALPQTALVEADDKYFVLALQNTSDTGYVFVKREVHIGLSSDNEIEILNTKDFQENTQFLIQGAFNLIAD